MSRFFIEVAYDGLKFSGFQKQENAVTIQSEVEKALSIFYRRSFNLTGASRTDSGVHAFQNFFHFDDDDYIESSKDLYHLNRILPFEIVIKKIFQVADNLHCRFDALKRHYEYIITRHKDPFLINRAYYYPYALDQQKLIDASKVLLYTTDFQAFSKKNSQVYTYDCQINFAEWNFNNDLITFNISGNRFLRGMVRGIVGTILHVGKGKNSIDDFLKIIDLKDCSKANFAVPPYALYLKKIGYGISVL